MPPVEHHDVAIVLGARIMADGNPSPAMVRRVRHALDLLQGGRVRAMLMTGGATTHDQPEAIVMRDLALSWGAEPAQIHVETQARNTIENARLVAPLLHANGWSRPVVVTDSFHLPRAWYIFRRFGLRVRMAAVWPERVSRDWCLAHLREMAALPWTVMRVEWSLLRQPRMPSRQ